MITIRELGYFYFLKVETVASLHFSLMHFIISTGIKINGREFLMQSTAMIYIYINKKKKELKKIKKKKKQQKKRTGRMAE